MRKTKIHFIGCGNMAGAMLTHWINDNAPIDTIIIKPTPPKATLAPHVKYVASLSEAPEDADIVMLGVKPQMMKDVYSQAVAHYGASPLYVTMAAGLPQIFYKAMAPECSLLRIMPNTPVAIGQGVVSGYISDEDATTHASQLDAISALLERLGTCCWLKDEVWFDPATAVAGSGPAYVYLFMDALTQAGMEQGLDADTSKKLAVNMVLGAAAYASVAEESLEQLRINVTSKGGTTAAALNVFMKDDALQGLTRDAIHAAVARAKELAQ